MTDQVDLAQQVLKAVEDLTEQGSVGFYASAIIALTGGDPKAVTRLLLEMVDEHTLEPRFEVRCPDNGRRIATYEDVDDIPLGEEVSSDRCDTPDPFAVDEADVYVRFRLNQASSSALRRRRRAEGVENPGKALRTRVHPGASPRFSLRPNQALSRR